MVKDFFFFFLRVQRSCQVVSDDLQCKCEANGKETQASIDWDALWQQWNISVVCLGSEDKKQHTSFIAATKHYYSEKAQEKCSIKLFLL